MGTPNRGAGIGLEGGVPFGGRGITGDGIGALERRAGGGVRFRRGGSTGARDGGLREDGRGAPNLGAGSGRGEGGAPF